MAAAQREADELTNTTEREAAKLRATADHEVAEKRATIERDIAKLRTSTEREVAQLKATAKRERDEILTTSKRQADEMRSQAQLILEESEAQRAQAEAEFEFQLAARREEAERQVGERLAAAQSATQKLVFEAEQRALSAEQRAAKASAFVGQVLWEGENLLNLASKSANGVRSYLEKLDISSTNYHRVEELDRQRQVVSARLTQFRELLEQVSPLDPDVDRFSGQTRAPEFATVMRGYSRDQVNDYLARLIIDPSLPMPNFESVMRGYDKEQVQRYIQGVSRPKGGTAFSLDFREGRPSIRGSQAVRTCACRATEDSRQGFSCQGCDGERCDRLFEEDVKTADGLL